MKTTISKRIFELNLPKGKSAFLWGPRKTGKSYWIKQNMKQCRLIDLLLPQEFLSYSTRPGLLIERLKDSEGLVVIDEVQKIPALLDEVHWLIENSSSSFLLTGSSARKLKHGAANLLGGRAWRRHMTPLSYTEVTGFDLEKIMVSGLLPPHYLSPDPKEELRAYLADYLKEEIAAEALVTNLPAFHEFLQVAALTSSELINYANVGRETGVSPKVVRSYFDVLEDTYLGYRVPPWTKSKNRRLIETEKFYFFDIGVANFLTGRTPQVGTPEFGKSFEHYILMELMAYRAYRQPEMQITFWRTSNGDEVDFVINDKALALEIKASRRVHDGDLLAMDKLLEDGPVKKTLVVSLESEPRRVGKQHLVLPWRNFLDQLWAGELV